MMHMTPWALCAWSFIVVGTDHIISTKDVLGFNLMLGIQPSLEQTDPYNVCVCVCVFFVYVCMCVYVYMCM